MMAMHDCEPSPSGGTCTTRPSSRHRKTTVGCLFQLLIPHSPDGDLVGSAPIYAITATWLPLVHTSCARLCVPRWRLGDGSATQDDA